MPSWFQFLTALGNDPMQYARRTFDQEEVTKRAWSGYWPVVMLLLATAAARAGDSAAKGQPELKEGVLYGVVMDAETQKPIAGATVAAFDKKGHPLAWG